MNFATLSNAELRRLESDRGSSPEMWRAAVAEIARRESFPTPPPATYTQPVPQKPRVILAGVDVPFWDLIVVLIQIGIASIPAILIVTAVFAAGIAIWTGVFAAIAHR